MINGSFVFNAVAHANNMADDNMPSNHYAHALRDLLVVLHRDWQEGGLDRDQQCTDWPIEVLARTLFLESDCDMAATHTLRLDSLFKDGLCRREKTIEAVRRWPQRFVGYVGVDPTNGLDKCLDELEEQVAEMPEAVGLKLYPAQVAPHRGWRFDDEKLAYPLFERAQSLGLRTIAVHKTVPFGPVPIAPFRVDDMDLTADAFPELSFEIIHAGMAFTEETALMLARFPNVYANLEVTSQLINSSPGTFETVMAQFIKWGGAEKILYSDGSMVSHTQPIIEKFSRFRFKEETLRHYGLKQLTDTDIGKMLGGNYARVLGIDIEEAKREIVDDEFAREKARTGPQAPYSNWLKHLRGEPMGVAV
jgi:predicted TIM-barrel fold metal-dependent hydrolase